MWIGLPSGSRLRWHLEIMQYLPLSGWLNFLNSFSFSALELLTVLSDSFGLITLYKQKKGSDSRRGKKEGNWFFFFKDGPENTKLKLFHIRSLCLWISSLGSQPDVTALGPFYALQPTSQRANSALFLKNHLLLTSPVSLIPNHVQFFSPCAPCHAVPITLIPTRELLIAAAASHWAVRWCLFRKVTSQNYRHPSSHRFPGCFPDWPLFFMEHCHFVTTFPHEPSQVLKHIQTCTRW